MTDDILRRIEIMEAAIVRPNRSYVLAKWLAGSCLVALLVTVILLIHIDMTGERVLSFLMETYDEGREAAE